VRAVGLDAAAATAQRDAFVDALDATLSQGAAFMPRKLTDELADLPSSEAPHPLRSRPDVIDLPPASRVPLPLHEGQAAVSLRVRGATAAGGGVRLIVGGQQCLRLDAHACGALADADGDVDLLALLRHLPAPARHDVWLESLGGAALTVRVALAALAPPLARPFRWSVLQVHQQQAPARDGEPLRLSLAGLADGIAVAVEGAPGCADTPRPERFTLEIARLSGPHSAFAPPARGPRSAFALPAWACAGRRARPPMLRRPCWYLPLRGRLHLPFDRAWLTVAYAAPPPEGATLRLTVFAPNIALCAYGMMGLRYA
jgi:hypothetical protein